MGGAFGGLVHGIGRSVGRSAGWRTFAAKSVPSCLCACMYACTFQRGTRNRTLSMTCMGWKLVDMTQSVVVEVVPKTKREFNQKHGPRHHEYHSRSRHECGGFQRLVPPARNTCIVLSNTTFMLLAQIAYPGASAVYLSNVDAPHARLRLP